MKYKLHYGKKQYLYTFLSIVAVLFVVRLCHPELTRSLDKQTAVSRTAKTPLDSVAAHALMTDSLLSSPYALPRDLSTQPLGRRHRILSVPGFERTFPDLNDVQIATAQRLGVKPVQNRDVASHADYHQLVYIGNSPYYDLKRLDHSIPYLVPRAQMLLNRIARTFVDSQMVKGVHPSKIIVTSLMRSKDDVALLRRRNQNATENSCHCYGTTFDVSWSKFHVIQDPDGPRVRETRNDSLKWILSEVLRDQREAGLCYVKYEVKQGCFHIPVR